MILLLQQVFQWWILLFIIGIIFLPIASLLFPSFFDKGYAFSKTVGVIIISYLMLVLSIVHILPFATFSLLAILCLCAIISMILILRKNMISSHKISWKIFLFEEILFFSCLFFWSFIKTFQPDIHGLEKFMDYGFVNSILRTTYFPPKDMWMTPLSINYYYFGHLQTAVLTKLSNLPSALTFNLMLATLFALTFLGSFSLAGNFIHLFWKKQNKTVTTTIKVAAFSLLTAFLLTMGGNLHTIYTFFTPYQNDSPVAPWELVFAPQTFPNQYWYPNATRFIHNTIHEFPGYSFVVSDLHGHVLDIPNVLLMIGLLLVVFTTTAETTATLALQTAILGSLSGILYMTNAWDGLIYIGASSLLLLFKFFRKEQSKFLAKRFFSFLILLFACFLVISLPFSLFFKPFASQVGLNCAPDFLLQIKHIGPLIFEKGFCQHSPIWQLGILYGFFFFWFISLLVFLLFNKKQTIQSIDVFIIGLGLLGFALIVVPEFVYLKDIYTTYFRANTMFKLVYQSFILLSLVSGYSIYRISSSFSNKLKKQNLLLLPYLLIGAFLITIVAIYPYFAITSYFNDLKTFQGLNGLAYLQTLYPDDYKAILWIHTHITGQPVLLEAQGDSYTDYERISSNTGLPTVFGWMVHEWLWRGTYDIVPGRIQDVQDLYESQSIEYTKRLLQKYHVMYVYIGSMERKKYPNLNEEKFKELGTVIYSSGTVIIYKIKSTTL